MASCDFENNTRTVNLSRLQLRTLDTSALMLTHKFCPENVTKLIISRNSLTVLPSSVSQFLNLRELDASSNEISWITGEISHLRKLEILDIHTNRLRNIPKEFEQCQKLKHLNLGGNLFTDIPTQIYHMTSLKELYLGGNQIRKIESAIERLKCLETLYLGGNHITTVTSQLKNMSQLKHLILCDNKLEAIPQELGRLKNLQSLSLHQNNLKTLPMGIISLRNLQELTLRDNPLVNTFVKKLEFNPPSLLEIAGRYIKRENIPYEKGDIPNVLYNYLRTAKCCVNPKCDGVYFDARVRSVKFVDFCGRFRLPLEQYLCSPCEHSDDEFDESVYAKRMQRVLLPPDVVDSD